MRFIGVFAWLALVSVLGAATLSDPRRVGTGFEFSVSGASNAVYAIEVSVDLQNWTKVVTNRELGEVRMISLPASTQAEFYRVRLLQRLFTGAMAVRESIEFKGSGVRVDSFDSADPLASTDGQYDPAKARDHGDIMTNSALTNSLDIGNAKVLGVLQLAPGGSPILGPSASVGSGTWVNSGQFGIEPGHLVEGTSRVFADAEVPTGHVYVTPGPGTVNGANYQYVLSDGHYILPELRYSTVVTGGATLYVSGSAEQYTAIVILPGASLDLYVGGAVANLARVDNRNATAFAFAYYGLPGNTNVSVQGNASFNGTIYAPAASVAFGGGGNDEIHFFGAIIGRTIKVYGKMGMHYDERLGVAGPEL